jgi:serine/threonine protein kinase
LAAQFRREVKIMRTLRHPNIVEFLGVCMEAPNLCLVTEYLSNGSLEDVLERMSLKDGKFSLKRIISLAKDIARGLNWLHHKGIIHRDLKSANILLDQNGKGKICDFGLSHVKVQQSRDPTRAAQTQPQCPLAVTAADCAVAALLVGVSGAWTCPVRTASAARRRTWLLRC